MIRAIVQSIVMGEAAVGLTLLVLLVLGRQEAGFIANTLVLVGAWILLIRSLPHTSGRAIRFPSEGSTRIGERLMQTETLIASRRLRKPAPIAARSVSRMLLGLVSAVCVLGTALLFYDLF